MEVHCYKEVGGGHELLSNSPYIIQTIASFSKLIPCLTNGRVVKRSALFFSTVYNVQEIVISTFVVLLRSCRCLMKPSLLGN